ncbi:rhomboid family intramembrane serine protease [Aeromicrobium panaciterrae]|uniref:rhomboid family intramembrane serine protease n=1 Tax=Aeromicrobium panaciterrae TaxID=363861 RepID=UPI0031D5E36D
MSEPDPAWSPLSTAMRAGLVSGGFVGVLWLIEVLDRILPGDFESHGVEPRTDEGLQGVVFAPLLHGDWDHLVSNSLPLLMLGFLLALSGLRTFAVTTAIIWVVGGIGVWLIAGTNTIHIGASGVVFGWLVFLIVRGVFAKNLRQIVLGVVMFMAYGTILLGVLPGEPGVSWEGHLFGAIGGAIAAWFARDDAEPAAMGVVTG